MYRVTTTFKMPRGTQRYYTVTPELKAKLESYKKAGKLQLVREVELDESNMITARYINDWQDKATFDEFNNWFETNYKANNDSYNTENNITKIVETQEEI